MDPEPPANLPPPATLRGAENTLRRGAVAAEEKQRAQQTPSAGHLLLLHPQMLATTLSALLKGTTVCQQGVQRVHRERFLGHPSPGQTARGQSGWGQGAGFEPHAARRGGNWLLSLTGIKSSAAGDSPTGEGKFGVSCMLLDAFNTTGAQPKPSGGSDTAGRERAVPAPSVSPRRVAQIAYTRRNSLHGAFSPESAK